MKGNEGLDDHRDEELLCTGAYEEDLVSFFVSRNTAAVRTRRRERAAPAMDDVWKEYGVRSQGRDSRLPPLAGVC